MGEFQSLSKLLRKYVEDGLPGCGIIIAKHGEILFEEYVGWSDVEKQNAQFLSNAEYAIDPNGYQLDAN